MAEEGYNFEVCGYEFPDMKCPICLLLMRDAMEMPCSHNACRMCLQRWEAEQTG